jgi:hypothetical protein
METWCDDLFLTPDVYCCFCHSVVVFQQQQNDRNKKQQQNDRKTPAPCTRLSERHYVTPPMSPLWSLVRYHPFLFVDPPLETFSEIRWAFSPFGLIPSNLVRGYGSVYWSGVDFDSQFLLQNLHALGGFLPRDPFPQQVFDETQDHSLYPVRSVDVREWVTQTQNVARMNDKTSSSHQPNCEVLTPSRVKPEMS